MVCATRALESADGIDYSLVTRSSDGQMLFLANMISKMNHKTPLGSRIAEVHNGSSLFTGDAGQGESNIRRWIIENDWLEAIVALPLSALRGLSFCMGDDPMIAPRYTMDQIKTGFCFLGRLPLAACSSGKRW